MKLNCKEADKLIPYFLKNELNNHDLKRFVEHIAGCPDCKEELSIQFLVEEGMNRLEEGGSFDLQSELNKRLEGEKTKMRFRTGFQVFVYTLEILAILTIIMIIIMVIIL